jgi:hypothetical protein
MKQRSFANRRFTKPSYDIGPNLYFEEEKGKQLTNKKEAALLCNSAVYETIL